MRVLILSFNPVCTFLGGTLFRDKRHPRSQQFLKRPAMISQLESHRGRSMVIAMHSILLRQSQGLMRSLEVVIEDLQAHERVKGGIPLSERVCLAGECIKPIAQGTIESLHMHCA